MSPPMRPPMPPRGPNPEELALANQLYQVLAPFEDQPAVKRIRFRLRDLGRNNQDEVAQFRLLQRACREDAALARAFVDAGLPAIQDLVVFPPNPQVGPYIQAFNRLVESRWEER